MQLTRETIAWMAAGDAGDRSMRAAGRAWWNGEDYRSAAAAYERVMNGRDNG